MPMHHPFQARRDAPPPAEDAAEFELPAIFKPGHHAAVERPKLLGRLSEALKSTSPQNGPQDAGRARTVIPFDPASANGRMIEPPAALHGNPTNCGKLENSVGATSLRDAIAATHLIDPTTVARREPAFGSLAQNGARRVAIATRLQGHIVRHVRP